MWYKILARKHGDQLNARKMKKDKSNAGTKNRKTDTSSNSTVPIEKNAKRSKLKKYPNRTGYHGTHDERSLNAEE